MKKIVSIILVLCFLAALVSCTPKKEMLVIEDLSIEHETKFGGAYLHKTIEDFLSLGFECGDSVNVEFSNGYRIEDIPVYDGYYTLTGAPLLVLYPGYPYIKAVFNNGDDLFTFAELDESCTAVVSLAEKGKYLDVQNTMSMVYTDDRDSFASDEVFANFREMTGGNLADGLFFRGASPCDNQHNRAPYSSALCDAAGIGYILDLADSAEEAEGYYADTSLDCAYWKSIYSSGKVLPLDMSSNYRNENYMAAVVSAMKAVMTEDGPFFIHCTEGKDRTGFVCLLVEALAGASYDEIEKDYMETYANYYGVTKDTDPKGYKAVVDVKLMDMIDCLCGGEEVTAETLRAGAEKYLASGGMTEDEIAALEARITK